MFFNVVHLLVFPQEYFFQIDFSPRLLYRIASPMILSNTESDCKQSLSLNFKKSWKLKFGKIQITSESHFEGPTESCKSHSSWNDVILFPNRSHFSSHGFALKWVATFLSFTNNSCVSPDFFGIFFSVSLFPREDPNVYGRIFLVNRNSFWLFFTNFTALLSLY